MPNLHNRSKVMPAHDWISRPLWQKRLHGFVTYVFAALAALIYPVEVDKAMRDTLNKQFERQH